MVGRQLLEGRQKKGWSQKKAAFRLGVSQPYLSLLERGERRLTEKLAHKVVDLYELSADALPVSTGLGEARSVNEDKLAAELADLGYPGLSYLGQGQKKNPAEVVASALSVSNLDSRLVEALPWVLINHPNMDWQWLVQTAKLCNLQNRLGFLVEVARQVAENSGERDTSSLLAEQESVLEQARLACEGTLCHDSLTNAERNWLRDSRTEEAKRWGLLTDLSPSHLSYA
jgi:transcriptional regulator with XRE-family HTH domain